MPDYQNSMMNRRGPSALIVWIALSAMAAVGLIAWWQSQSNARLPKPPPPQAEVASDLNASTPANAASVQLHGGASRKPPAAFDKTTTRTQQVPGYAYLPGDVLEYRFKMERRVSLMSTGPGGGMQSAPPVCVRTQGTLTMAIYERLLEGWNVGFQFHGVEIGRGEDLKNLAPDRDFAGNLGAAGILARIKPSGAMDGLVFPDEMTAETRAAALDVLATWQVVLPERPKPQWSVEEEDTTGRYEARYTVRGGAGPVAITKEKIQYRAFHARNAGQVFGQSTLNGAYQIGFEGMIRTLEGTETATMATGGLDLGLATEAKSTFELSRQARQRLTPAQVALTRQAIAKAAGQTIGKAGAQSGALAASSAPGSAPRSTDIQGELALLRQLIASGKAQGAEEVQCMQELVQWIQRDPGSLAAIQARMADQSCGMAESGVLLGVLGAAGTAQAQQTLLDGIGGDRWSRERKSQALSSLVQIKEPIPQVEELLMGLRQREPELADQAALILGAVGDHLAQSAPERYSRIREQLLSDLAGAGGDEGRRIILLHARGNLSMEELPPQVSAALTERSEMVRTAAVQAMARVTTRQTTELLITTLNNDASAEVRARAAAVLAEGQRPEGRGALATRFRAEPSDDVRIVILQAMAGMESAPGAMDSILLEASKNDSSAKVREYARQLLLHPPQ